MSTLSVRTWVLMSIIPLSVLLQGCDDDCEGGGSGSGSGGLDPCKRDGTTVAEDKECFCSTGAGKDATKMEDNICTNPKVTPAPLASGVTAPPSTAPVGAFCWNSTGECNATAEPAACEMAWDLETEGDSYAASGCVCGTAGVCAADTVCKLAIAGTYSCAINSTVQPTPYLYDSTAKKMVTPGADENAGVTAGPSGQTTKFFVYAPGADYVCVYGAAAAKDPAVASCGSTPFADGSCTGTGIAYTAVRVNKSAFWKIPDMDKADGFNNDLAADTLQIASCHTGTAAGEATGYYIGTAPR